MIRKLTETQTQWGGRRRRPPHWCAAEGGACVSVNFLIILYHRYLWILLTYSLYVPYVFPSYVKYVFPCVFLNLWSQEKTSPYRKTTDIFFQRFYALHMIINNFMFFIQINDLLNKIGLWAHKVPYGPQPGPGPNQDWAPTRTENREKQ